MSKLNPIGIAQLVLVLLCAVAMKSYYSTASVNELRWILAPTAVCVELVSGTDFTFESYAGYMSDDHSFLIAASCSGVNFLITAFVMLSIGTLWRNLPQTTGWRFLPAAALTAYFATIAANTVRISTAMQLRRIDPEMIWLNPDQLHRFEGIVIYFGFLLLLFFVSDKINTNNASRSNKVSRLLRRSLFPLSLYYITTLGIPLANGAYSTGAGFWEHLLFVLFIPLLLILLLCCLFGLKNYRSSLERKFRFD